MFIMAWYNPLTWFGSSEQISVYCCADECTDPRIKSGSGGLLFKDSVGHEGDVVHCSGGNCYTQYCEQIEAKAGDKTPRFGYVNPKELQKLARRGGLSDKALEKRAGAPINVPEGGVTSVFGFDLGEK